MKIVIFESNTNIQSYFKKNFSDGAHELIFVRDPLAANNALDYLDAEIISVFIYSDVSKEVIDKLPKLKLITTRSTGCDHIDCAGTKEKNIIVSFVPAYARDAVVEFTFGLILNLIRNINLASNRLPEFGYAENQLLCGVELRGKTLGVIGAGSIGKRVIEIAQAFAMHVIVYDVHEDKGFEQEYNCTYLPFNEVLARADVLTLHAPCLKETYYMINSEAISCMKKGAYLINTARGGLVDVKALVQALLAGHLAGAACDVLEYEQFMLDPLALIKQKVPHEALQTILFNRLLISLPNTIITPHIAYCSDEAVQKMLEVAVANIQSFLSGSPKNLA